jgi:integrase
MGEHLGLDDVSSFSTHSLRKTKSSVIYQKTQSVEIVRRLLGQSSVTATSAYLGIEDSDALEVARNINI